MRLEQEKHGSLPEGRLSRARRKAPARLVFLAAFFFLSLVGAGRWVLVPYRILGSSMAPTLLGEEKENGVAGDLVLVNRLAYVRKKCERWDVVVLRRKRMASSDEVAEHESVKRVVGLPGETISVQNGSLHIDGRRTELPLEIKDRYVVAKEKYGLSSLTLGENEYFLLGDNSYSSSDSRRWGPVKGEDIQGRVCFLLFPFSRFGFVR